MCVARGPQSANHRNMHAKMTNALEGNSWHRVLRESFHAHTARRCRVNGLLVPRPHTYSCTRCVVARTDANRLSSQSQLACESPEATNWANVSKHSIEFGHPIEQSQPFSTISIGMCARSLARVKAKSEHF